jgi:hypothetical protein
MNAQTIAQAKDAAPESLWHFLAALPATMEAQIWYALLIGGAIGMVGHYIKGRSSGEIAGNPLDYFFRDNLWRSIGAAVAVASELFTEIGLGLFTSDAGVFVGWGIVMLSGLKTGYLGDSVVNKSTRPVWSAEKRAATVTLADPIVQLPGVKP